MNYAAMQSSKQAQNRIHSSEETTPGDSTFYKNKRRDERKGPPGESGPFRFSAFDHAALLKQAVWIEDELLCYTGVEGLVALGCVVERDHGCVDDLCDGEPVVQDCLHELAVVLQDGRLAGVEAV